MKEIEKYLNEKGELDVSDAICQILNEEIDKEVYKEKMEAKRKQLYPKKITMEMVNEAWDKAFGKTNR